MNSNKASANQPPASANSSGVENISIHVFDENRKSDKVFKCDKTMLIKYMKYFEKYLTEASSVDDIDISVHCDIKIFEWLIKYLHQKEQLAKAAAENGDANNVFAAKHIPYKKRTSEERQLEKLQDLENAKNV